MTETAQSTVSYEDLIQLEQDFDDVDLQMIRQQYALTKPLYSKRQDVIAKIPHFWALVLESAPPEVDQYIQPSDSKVFADCLNSIEVSRFELDQEPATGHPRSFSIKFGFAPNEYFEDTVLEKKFWFRRAADGWTGLVSEPVKIQWKKDQDLTEGLTDAAVKLWEAQKKQTGASNGKSKEKKLPEYDALVKKMETSEEGTLSFFTWFGFVSSREYISAEESAEANKAENEKREKRANGVKVDEKPEEEEEDDKEFELGNEAEVFPNGDELATLLAEDIWPSAIKYFTAAQEDDDEDLSSIDEADIYEEEDGDEPIDIRSLVGKGKKDGADRSPPAKKRRT
ncbi:uncharacterized protein K452DRAFT_253117 [Aplosporella prunicola CBS 121167]|uniref:Nap family protein n=1 Tax=Aplosporella prunicola CBS 121167 TaxID=1176127 RepID=A0A6A6BBP6_9PEZI|nr:uncharacterized protein K452DRAFT_253117 [Aplosporella prunicola CBS 121167]KAF2140337.1 hypothetical protein K452DRAFT_253117 [Aplosporella prunicola CBS 121167]